MTSSVDASTRVARRVSARCSHSRGLNEHRGDGTHAAVPPPNRMQGPASAATRDLLVANFAHSVLAGPRGLLANAVLDRGPDPC